MCCGVCGQPREDSIVRGCFVPSSRKRRRLIVDEEGDMTTNHNPHAFRITRGLRCGLSTEVPLPTRLVSNEEFPPLPQTPAQRLVEHRILAEAARLAPRLGLSRRDFLRTSGGMATSPPAMNAVVG